MLVAGGTGFVGSAVIRELVHRGERDVAILSRDPEGARRRFEGMPVAFRRGDVRDPDSLVSAMEGQDVVVNAVTFPNYPMENRRKGYTFAEVDGEGTRRIVDAARQAGVTKLLYVSGAGAAEDGEYPWLRVKWEAETAVRESGLTWTIVRPSWIFGPDDNALNRFIGMSRFLPLVPLIGAAGKQRLQPVFIGDVARLIAEATRNPATDDQLFEIGGAEVLSMREVVGEALAVKGRRRLLLSFPTWLMKIAATPASILPGPPLTRAAIDFVTMDAVVDNTALRERLGFEPTPLREALESYLRES